MLSAEGGIFTTIAGRYNATPDLEVFLKGHAGDLLRVDRKGRVAEHVPHPALTLGLAVQPEVLRDIARMPGFRGRGLLARILYSVPPNAVGHRRVGAPAVPEAVVAAYHDTLRALTLSLAEPEEPADLTLSADGDHVMLRLEAELEPRLADGAELGHVADWASKLNGAIARLAGLLHLAEHLRTGWDQPISAETVDDAARLGHYYLAHAPAVFDFMNADPVIEGARAVLDWITRTGTLRFTRRQLFTGISRARFRKATDLDQPLQLLEQHSYLRRAPASAPGRRGRPPARLFDVNPHTRGEISTVRRPMSIPRDEMRPLGWATRVSRGSERCEAVGNRIEHPVACHLVMGGDRQYSQGIIPECGGRGSPRVTWSEAT